MASTHTAKDRRGTSERRELRREFRDRRRALSDSEQRRHAQAVAGHFFAGRLPFSGRTVGAYMASDGELDPMPLVNRLLATRKRLALPVVRRDGHMDFYRLRRDTRLVHNRYGIAEPAPGAAYVAPLSLDVLLVPLVAFDSLGTRLGMGAGFYDRFLSKVPGMLRPRLIGLAHACQHSLDPLPFDAWDVPLDGVITELGWRTFDARETA